MGAIVLDFKRAWSASNRPQTAIFAGALCLAATSTVLGGASWENGLRLAIVELVGLPLLLFCARRLALRGVPRADWPALALLAAVLALPLLQLIPLPPSVWERLPGRAPMEQTLALAGLGRPAMPMSMAPQQTWQAFLALLPPAAMFLATLELSTVQKRSLVVCWLILALVGLLLGGLQVLGGSDSPLYPYETTNRGSAVGFFANRNHEATFVLTMIPFATVFALEARGDLRGNDLMPPLFAALFLAAAIVGIGAIDSRAGIALLPVAVAGCVALVVKASSARFRWGLVLGLGVAVLAGMAAVLLFGLEPILQRFAGGMDNETRFDAWPYLSKAAVSLQPFGGGLGSFENLTEAATPLNQVGPQFLNHAHNDYLEVWMETGWIGLAVLTAFLLWLLWTGILVWRSHTRRESIALMMAASISVLLVLLHSVVDYPLRIEAVAIVFAFCCGGLAVSKSGPS